MNRATYKKITESNLYKTYAAAIPKNRHKKLRDALAAVPEANLNKTNVSKAFVWRRTPQGHAFWHELYFYGVHGWKHYRRVLAAMV